jgi:hypothetical protein
VELKPDVVLFLTGINDVGASAAREQETLSMGWISFRSFEDFVVSLAQKSETISLIYNLYRFSIASSTGLAHSQLVLEDVPIFEGDLDEETVLAIHQKQYLPGYRERLGAVNIRL